MSTLKLPPPVVVRPGKSLAAQRPGTATLIGPVPLIEGKRDECACAQRSEGRDRLGEVHAERAAPAAGEPQAGRAKPARAASVTPTVPMMAAPSVLSAHAAPPHDPAQRGQQVAAQGPASDAGVAPAASPGPRAEPARVQSQRRADSPLFRYEALRAYKLGLRLSTPLRVVPLSTSAVLGAIGAALLAALIIASLGHIDLVARGRGTIRAHEGVQPLLFEIEGVVREVLVEDGELASAGQPIVRLDSTRLRAALREADEQLAAIRERTEREHAQAERTYTRDKALLARRARLTRSRIASQQTSLGALEREQSRYQALTEDGLVADKVLRDSVEQAHQEGRTLLALQDELARIDQQESALEQSLRTGVTQRAHELREAQNRRDTARVLLGQTELRASRAGRIESLTVSAGDVIEPGRVVARLVSLASHGRVTAFMPERERAFVRAGGDVRVEFDQLPVGEFGSASARVVRVSSEVASPLELERALGAAAPEGVHFAVTLVMGADARTRSLLAKVGSGTLVTVRMPVRRRRIISLVFDPVRRWLD